jgi:dihydroflavonol-4-reductase
MKIFMTGATGLVGSFLAEALLQKNHKVRCLVRKESNLRWIADLDVDCFYGSLFDKESLKNGIEDCEIIIHVAGVTKARTEADYFNANFEGTRNLIDVCLQNSENIKKFVNISSQTVVGPSPTIIPIDETYDPKPLTFYAKSKLAAEQYVMEQKKKIPVVNLRPSGVYGPRDTDILEFFKIVNKGIIPQLGGVDKYLSLIHVHELARGIIMAMGSAKAKGKTYFLADEQPYSWKEVSDATLRVLGKKGFRIPIPLALLKGVSVLGEGIAALTKKPALINRQKILEIEPNFWTCSADKAFKDFGFRSEIKLENGIADTIAWYKENKWM